MLPAQVIASARMWNVSESEGLIVFSESHGLALGAFSSRVSFQRTDTADGWQVSVHGHNELIRVGTLIALYRVLEAEYGGPCGRRLAADGRMSREQVVPWSPKEPRT